MSLSRLPAFLRQVLPVRPVLPAPDELQLRDAFERATAAAACYAVAALLVHQSGYHSQRLTYVAMAVATLPQVLMLAIARRDPGRRKGLRISGRPMLMHAAIAIILAVMALAVLITDGLTFGPGWAAAVAAGAATLAAYPPVVWFPGRADTAR